MSTHVEIIRPADAPARQVAPSVTALAPPSGVSVERLAEALAVVSSAVRGDSEGALGSWGDGTGGRYLEARVPAWSCPDMDICVHDGRVFVHVKE